MRLRCVLGATMPNRMIRIVPGKGGHGGSRDLSIRGIDHAEQTGEIHINPPKLLGDNEDYKAPALTVDEGLYALFRRTVRMD